MSVPGPLELTILNSMSRKVTAKCRARKEIVTGKLRRKFDCTFFSPMVRSCLDNI